jgi:hypothetical protein
MKNRTLLIVIGVILLCCCVVVIAGAIAYPRISRYLNSVSSGLQNLNPSMTSTPETASTSQPAPTAQPSSGPVDGGLGDPTLKADVWNAILTAESGRGCNNVTSTAIDVAQQPDSNRVWIEDWSASVCGNDATFEVTFTPDPKGGTNYDIKQK